MKNRLKFDLGNTQEEVRGELKKYYEFYRNKNEKTLFCNLMLSTFKKIVNDEFNLNVH